MTPELSGKRVVVTGGASGIGAGIVREFGDRGVTDGVVLDLPGTVDATVLPDGWTSIAVDLRSDTSIAQAFAEVREVVDTVDVLVAAAGVVPAWTGIGALDPSEWDEVFAVNVRGVMRCIQEVERSMGAGGAIVVIASQNAWRGNQHLAGYTASKHAVLGLVRSVALELGPRGIRVNAVGPGSVPTDAYLGRLRRRAEEGGLTVEAALERERLATPLLRLTTIEDVARATVFLAGELASGVTGHVLPVGAPLT